MNPFDPSDAAQDKDGDKFTNLAEYRADTDPADAASHPPYDTELRVVKIVADPFRLMFKSIMKLPDGTLKFAINTRESRTYFKKIGEEVEGFVLEKYEPKVEEREEHGMKRKVDVSILTLRRGEKLIPLVKGEGVPYSEYKAHLAFDLTGANYEVKAGQSFDLLGQKYTVIGIDNSKQNIVLNREQDNQQVVISKVPARETGKGEGRGPAASPRDEGDAPQ